MGIVGLLIGTVLLVVSLSLALSRSGKVAPSTPRRTIWPGTPVLLVSATFRRLSAISACGCAN